MAAKTLRSDPVPSPRDRNPGPHADRRLPVVTTREAAAALGVSEQAVRQAIARGSLAAGKYGRGWRIRQDELDRYAERRRGGRAVYRQTKVSTLITQPGVSTLPAPAARFVGRDAELAALVARLEHPAERIVTLTGPGGVGKTRLALAAARALDGCFPDGIHFVDLAPISRPQLVLPTIAQSLALREQPGRELSAQLTAYLRGKRILFVLDNFEQVIEAAPDVAWIAAHAPEVKVLVTSRAPLRIGGERVAPVTPLTLADERAGVAALLASDAGRLFVERALEHRPDIVVDDATAPVIADICARLDGLPLAIELAGAWTNVLSLSALRDLLVQRLPLLARGVREAPARQQTMRDTIAWSHDLLSPDQQRGFQRLSIFAGGCTLTDAAAVWAACDGQDQDTAVAERLIDLIGALVDQNLLVRESGTLGEPRFRMLGTIREFGQAQLEAGDAAALRDAHARHYFQLATTLRPLMETLATQEPIDRLVADDANVMQALAWLDECGQAADVARMVVACKIYWYAVGRLSEAEVWLERAQSVIDQAAPGDRALLLTALGELRMVKGDPAGAARFMAEGEALLRVAGDPFDLTMGLTAFGAALNYGGNYPHAELRLREALSIAEGIADGTLRAAFESDAFHNLSISARGQGDLDRAAAYADQALRGLHGHGLALAEHRVLATMSGIAKDRGDLSRAIAGYQSLLGQLSERGETWVVAAAFAGIAHAAAAWGQPRAAMLLVGAADVLRERWGGGIVLPAEASLEHRNRAALRAAVGDREFEAMLAEGRAMSLTDAIVVAMAVNDPARLVPPRETAGQALTRREQQVLGLLASGQTDREIADALFVSPRTVSWHVRSILAKLGAASRHEAVSSAKTQGLVELATKEATPNSSPLERGSPTRFSALPNR